tara:strand:- start:4531 stop:4749 length:219 start_codon:yes stop_codon:yes gene_type:complete
MLKQKNDYSVIVLFEEGTKPKKWQYVHKLNGFSMFLKKKHPTWKYMNVYNRRAGTYMRRFHRDSFVPPFITE